MEEETEQEYIQIETEHFQSSECNCVQCQKSHQEYVQILDVDSYIESLNDWD